MGKKHRALLDISPDRHAEGGDTVGVTNADAFKMLFEGLYATELWSWSEEKFLKWLNMDYAGSALPEYFDRPVCQCCGKPLDHLMVNMFAYDGSDSFEKTALTYIKEADCVAITTSRNWTGYELDDEERKETIVCPECGKYPFDKTFEIRINEPVELAMWTSKQTDAQRDYEAAVEMTEYCERYESTYNPEDGSM